MKRHHALQNISREHQHTLSFSQKIIRAIQADDIELIDELCEQAVIFCETELKPHFAQEEETFFKIITENYPEYKALAETYLDEHKALINLVMELDNNPSSDQLEAFAILLKLHTRNEERKLFPLIEGCFTEQQLQMIKKYTTQ